MSLLINEVDVGADPLRNNLHMYRMYTDQRSILNCPVGGGVIDTTTSEFQIFYKQYYKDTNGDMIDPQERYYRIMDVPGFNNLTNRLTQLWDSPIDDSAPGLRNAIEAVLAALPFTVENGYVLNT